MSIYEEDFSPTHSRTVVTPADARIAAAAEYSAHHMGKISRNLEKLIAILEKKVSVDGGQF